MVLQLLLRRCACCARKLGVTEEGAARPGVKQAASSASACVAGQGMSTHWGGGLPRSQALTLGVSSPKTFPQVVAATGRVVAACDTALAEWQAAEVARRRAADAAPVDAAGRGLMLLLAAAYAGFAWRIDDVSLGCCLLLLPLLLGLWDG